MSATALGRLRWEKLPDMRKRSAETFEAAISTMTRRALQEVDASLEGVDAFHENLETLTWGPCRLWSPEGLELA